MVKDDRLFTTRVALFGRVGEVGGASDLGNCDPAVIHRHRCMSRDAGIVFRNWSGARDLNPGPHGPEPCRWRVP